MHTEHQGHCWCMHRHSWKALDLCSDYTCSSQVDKDREKDHSDSVEDPEQRLPSSLPKDDTEFYRSYQYSITDDKLPL